MTKLMEWLSILSVMGALWVGLLTNKFKSEWVEKNPTIIMLIPVIAAALFLIYAATTVLYRVFTFNDCEEAAAEIQKQIQEAKTDLTKKGFVFKT